jgi:hypothetical protein
MRLSVEAQLRRFLLALAGAMCLGTVVELWLADHTQEPLQWVPFVLAGLGLVTLMAFWLRPTLTTLWALRSVMGLVVVGAGVGVVLHLLGNREIVLETRPGADALTMLWLALRGGAPALAPGILAVTAALAGAATYRHPMTSRNASAPLAK